MGHAPVAVRIPVPPPAHPDGGSPRAARRRRLAAGVALLLAAAIVGCSGDGDDDAGPAGAIVTPTASDDADGATTDDGATGPTPPRTLEGKDVNRQAMRVGDCFNDYAIHDAETGEVSYRTTTVGCGRPHDGEVFASHVHPADAQTPFPGRSEMMRWAVAACYQDFAGFIGLDYELSALEIGVVTPDDESWIAGPHREVLCYVEAPDGAQLTGTMASAAV